MGFYVDLPDTMPVENRKRYWANSQFSDAERIGCSDMVTGYVLCSLEKNKDIGQLTGFGESVGS
jgi:hypothetical protein